MKSIYQIVDKQRKFLKRCGYKYTTSALNETEFTVILNKNYKNSENVDVDDADYIVYVNTSKKAIQDDTITSSICVILGSNRNDIPRFVRKFERRIANAVYDETIDSSEENKVVKSV